MLRASGMHALSARSQLVASVQPVPLALNACRWVSFTDPTARNTPHSANRAPGPRRKIVLRPRIRSQLSISEAALRSANRKTLQQATLNPSGNMKCAKFSSSLSVSPVSVLSPACGRPSPYRNRFVTSPFLGVRPRARWQNARQLAGAPPHIRSTVCCQEDLLLGRGTARRAERHRLDVLQSSLQSQLNQQPLNAGARESRVARKPAPLTDNRTLGN